MSGESKGQLLAVRVNRNPGRSGADEGHVYTSFRTFPRVAFVNLSVNVPERLDVAGMNFDPGVIHSETLLLLSLITGSKTMDAFIQE